MLSFFMNAYKRKKRTTLSSPNAESKPAETITRSGENFMQEEEKKREMSTDELYTSKQPKAASQPADTKISSG